MKKISLILTFICLVFTGVLSTNAQVDYSVKFYWDESNCECSGTILNKWAMAIIRTYPGGNLVHQSDWYQISTSPYILYDDTPTLNDCEEPCYNIAIIIKIEDIYGICCYGADNDNVTGQELKNGYTMTNTIVLY